jgi:hypothetical protein
MVSIGSSFDDADDSEDEPGRADSTGTSCRVRGARFVLCGDDHGRPCPMRYMLLIYGCERRLAGTRERDAKIAAIAEFTEKCRADGVLLAYDPLRAPDTAATVRVRDGEATVTDGPFAETAEWLGGYYLLDCQDQEEALAYAARCPLAAEGAVEVRPIMEVETPRSAG